MGMGMGDTVIGLGGLEINYMWTRWKRREKWWAWNGDWKS